MIIEGALFVLSGHYLTARAFGLGSRRLQSEAAAMPAAAAKQRFARLPRQATYQQAAHGHFSFLSMGRRIAHVRRAAVPPAHHYCILRHFSPIFRPLAGHIALARAAASHYGLFH